MAPSAKRKIVREMRKTVRAKTARTAPPLPAARTVASAPQSRAKPSTQKSSLAEPSRRIRADGAVALRKIVSPLHSRQGFRVVWLGDSGMGKTSGQKELAKVAQSIGLLTITHDDLAPDSQYEGSVRANVAELEARPLAETEDDRAIVFRGDAHAGIVVEVEEVAAFALRLARQDLPVLLQLDELDRAVTPGGRELVSESLRVALTQGRKLGLCVSSTTQSPARAPREVLDQATSIVLYRLGPRALRYLDAGAYLEAEPLEVIEKLQPFEFVLLQPSQPWDRTIYRFPKPPGRP